MATDLIARFGPAGNCDDFAAAGYKHSADMPVYAASFGLNAYEYQCGRGVRLSDDTAAALRAAEIGADVIFKATNVDGVFDSDPKKNPNAVKFDKLSHHDVLQKELHVMDATAASLCMDNKIKILVFNLDNPDNIVKAVKGETIGTLVE